MAEDQSPTLEQTVARHFECPRCRYHHCDARRVKVATEGHPRLHTGDTEVWLAVSCRQCGFTDFYDVKVLQSSDTYIGAFLYKNR